MQEQKIIHLPWGFEKEGSPARRQHSPAKLSVLSFTQSPCCSQITALHLADTTMGLRINPMAQLPPTSSFFPPCYLWGPLSL